MLKKKEFFFKMWGRGNRLEIKSDGKKQRLSVGICDKAGIP